MKLKYHYSYSRFTKFAIIAAIIASFLFVAFGMLCLSGLNREGLSNSDIYLFLGLFFAFTLFGIGMFSLAFFVHRNMKTLGKSDTFYGIDLHENTLISQDFGGLFKRKPQQIDKYDICETELRPYKGVEFLTIKTHEKTAFLPVHLLSPEDKAKLLAFVDINSINKKPITENDLRIAAAFLFAVENTFNHKFPNTAKRTSDFEYLFGFSPELPKDPHISLVKNGPSGDSYSGYSQSSNDLELHGFLDSKKRWLNIKLIEAEHDLAGFRLDFYFSSEVSEETQISFRENFDRSINEKNSLPASFLKLLPKPHRS